MPNPTPNSMRAPSSSQNEPESPVARSDAAIRSIAARVRRRTPKRSASMVAGMETARMVTLAAASSMPLSTFERSNFWAYVGTSGTSAVHTTSPTKIPR